MDGIILAAGNGSRLNPITKVVNKHILPIYDKPMIYYPLTTLILSGIQRITIVTNPKDLHLLRDLLGDGKEFGIKIQIVSQNLPEGLPNAIRAALVGGEISGGVQVILGDNIFHGIGLGRNLAHAGNMNQAGIFSISVKNPENFGVIKFDSSGKITDICEKPEVFVSNAVIPGLYFLPSDVISRIDSLEKSSRGEYEIVDLLKSYLKDNQLLVTELGRGTSWFDGGTVESIVQASNFVRTSQERQGQLVGSPHEAALNQGLINSRDLLALGDARKDSPYWASILKLV